MPATSRAQRRRVAAISTTTVGQTTRRGRESADSGASMGRTCAAGDGTELALSTAMPVPFDARLPEPDAVAGVVRWPRRAPAVSRVAPGHGAIGARALRAITERVDAATRLAAVAEMAGVHGDRLLDALTAQLAAAVGVTCAVVAEVVDAAGPRLRSLSAFGEGGCHPGSFDFDATASPWADVVAHGLRNHEGTLQRVFPDAPAGPAWPAAGFAGIPLRDHAGKVIGVLAVAHDRTLRLDDEIATMLRIVAARAGAEIERRQLAQRNHQLQLEIEQRVGSRTAALQATNAELEAFAYSVSHDLRAPLRQISGFAALLTRSSGTALAPSVRQHLDDITDAARGMSGLIERMLDFSRAGRRALRRTDVELTRLAREVVADLSRETKGRNIEWSIGALPRVRGDAILLRQVIFNLLSNAVKYSRPCNLACIEVGVLVSESPGDIVCFVRDNGVGFDMRHVARLFSVFSRLHPGSAFEGTGIGLANVRRVVHRHGGRVWATGEVGGGATFYFSLPVADDSPAGGSQATSDLPRAS